MSAHDLAVAVNDVARAWQDVGRNAPVAASTSAGACAMPGCSGMAFVELKTSAGSTSLCFAHFESVQKTQPETPI